MKYYTTIEQSKKLVDLGIDVNSADMYYPYYLEFDKYPSTPLALDDELKNYQLIGEDIPCWSTEALLNILDEIIVIDENEEYHLAFGKDGTSYYMFYEDVYRLVNNVIEELDFSCSTLLTCAFEMIVKLKELKLI